MGYRIDYARTSTAGVLAYSEVEHYLSHCGLDEHLLDLVYLRVSQLNGCAFCTDLHTRMLTKAGIGPEKLALVQVWAHSGQLFQQQKKPPWHGPNMSPSSPGQLPGAALIPEMHRCSLKKSCLILRWR